MEGKILQKTVYEKDKKAKMESGATFHNNVWKEFNKVQSHLGRFPAACRKKESERKFTQYPVRLR
jgi:hypothetical protein